MRKAALITAAAAGVLGGLVVSIGYLLPQRHVASRTVRLPARPVDVFATLTDVERYPSWRSDVKDVQVLSRSPMLQWREDGDNGPITFEVRASEPPVRLVTRIADRSLPFGGSWTYELSPDAAGTALTITEDGEVYNPVFRFVSRFVFGHTATIDRFLKNLEVYLTRRAGK